MRHTPPAGGGTQLLQLFLQPVSMYLAFFWHSPEAAHLPHSSSRSTQPPGSTSPPIRPTWIHFVALYLVPFRQGTHRSQSPKACSPSGGSDGPRCTGGNCNFTSTCAPAIPCQKLVALRVANQQHTITGAL